MKKQSGAFEKRTMIESEVSDTSGQRDINRYMGNARLFQLALMLSARSYRLTELADRFDLSVKTIRRMLYAIERIPLQLYSEKDGEYDGKGTAPNVYRIDPRWIKRFMPDDVLEFWGRRR